MWGVRKQERKTCSYAIAVQKQPLPSCSIHGTLQATTMLQRAKQVEIRQGWGGPCPGPRHFCGCLWALRQQPTPLPSGHVIVLVPDHSSKVTFGLWSPLLKHQGHRSQCQGERRSWFSFREDHSSFPHQKPSECTALAHLGSHRENFGVQVSSSPNCPDLVPQSQKRHLTQLCAALVSQSPRPPASTAHSKSQAGVLWPTAG